MVVVGRALSLYNSATHLNLLREDGTLPIRVKLVRVPRGMKSHWSMG